MGLSGTTLRRWLAALILALGSLLGPLAPVGPSAAQTVAPAQAPAQAPAPAVESALRTVEAQLGLLLGRYATPLEAAALLGAGWAGALEAAGEVAGADASRAFAPDRGAAWADFGARFRALAQGPGADPGALARAANRAMARSLGDCHTSLAASHEREVRSLDGAERYGGVGASVADPATFEPRPPGPLVVQVTEGGPAEQAGIRAGDAVLAVDGTDAAGLPPARLVELVRGEAGTPVRLRLDRPGAPAPVEVTVERALLEPRPVEGRLLSVPGAVPGAVPGVAPVAGAPGAQVGYVALREFSRAAEAALPAKLEELHAAGATHWVLDLRGNRGGNLQTFTRLGSLFLEEGTLAVTIDRNGAESSISADGTAYRPYLRPLAVLVDRQSASAAELLAADLQEYGAARLFGSTTAGCFGTSRLFRLPDGSGLWLTVSALQSGLARRDVHRVGLDPDEAVGRTRSELSSGVDGPLARALAWVTESG